MASTASGSRHPLWTKTQYRGQLSDPRTRSEQPVPMHPKLLETARCRHCKRDEALEPPAPATPNNGDHHDDVVVVDIESSALLLATPPNTGYQRREDCLQQTVQETVVHLPRTSSLRHRHIRTPAPATTVSSSWTWNRSSSAPAVLPNTTGGDHRVEIRESSAMTTRNNGNHRVEGIEPSSSSSPAPPPPNPVDHGVPVGAAAATPAIPQRLSLLQGPYCYTCVQMIYEQTVSPQELPPAGSTGGDTLLHHAARCGNLRILYHLIRLMRGEGVHHDRAVEAVKMLNDNEETALHTAVSVGNLEIVELLLWVHPPLGKMTCFDISPIYLAVSLGRMDIAEALHHDDASSTSTGICYSGPNSKNALHAAALLHHKGDDMTQMILGWNIELAKDKDGNGRTPLHFAVSVRQRRSIYIGHFRFPWHWRESGSVRQLLDADSSMAYEKDNGGLFPIHVAAMTNSWHCIDILVERCTGCMDLRDNQGRTFLHVAVKNNSVLIVKYVCRRPELAQILNIQDKDGNTALHLAVDAQNLRVLCHLLKNQEVLLNLRNKKGETALDIARRRIREGFFFRGNPDKLIYRTLQRVGAQHAGCFLWDRVTVRLDTGRPTGLAEGEERTTPADDLEKEESAKLADSTRTLGIGSVLITSVTFAATITRVPGPEGSSNNKNNQQLARSWEFEAFMVANALAFICASTATVGLMYSGMAMVTLRLRRLHFKISLMFVSSSVTCLTAAFALGAYMVLAPAARAAAIIISAICPLVVIYKSAQGLYNHALVSGALRARKGFLSWLKSVVLNILLQMLLQFWPFIVIFAWAAHSHSRHHG